MLHKHTFVLIALAAVLVITSTAIYISKNADSLLTPPCVELPADTPQKPIEFVPDNQDLVFLTEIDKEKLYSVIDSATDAKDFDDKFFYTLSEVFDSHTTNDNNVSGFLLAPEIMSDNPEGIEITSGGCKTDLLAGIDLSPIKKEDMPHLKSFAKLFIEETSRYPLSWWSKAVPPFLVFVKAVKVNGEVVGGAEHGAVIYNISEIENIEGARMLIHHELMHWVELSTRTRTDTGWPGTPSDYLHEYNLTSYYNYREHPKTGFVTGYAQTNSQEDKAEIYSYLFNKEGLKKLNMWAKTDPILAKKVKYFKDFIKARVTKMDDKYFDAHIVK